jgi:hypothetical protein
MKIYHMSLICELVFLGCLITSAIVGNIVSVNVFLICTVIMGGFTFVLIQMDNKK